MEKRRIFPILDAVPTRFHSLLQKNRVFDSSCSQAAQVLFIDGGQGFYLKSAERGKLAQEVQMTRYYFEKGLGPEVLAYESCEKDWLLTAAIPGSNCLADEYLKQPSRLAETLGNSLRLLHDQPYHGCPVLDMTEKRLASVAECYHNRWYDDSFFPDNWGYSSAMEAWQEIECNGKYLQQDTLIHGDYCLPNVMLHRWLLSGFLDLGNAGISDRHFDLFWGMWSLEFNLKTDRYTQRFLDAYGQESVNKEILRLIAAIEVFG